MNREQLEQKRDEIRTQNDTAWNRMLNLLQQRDHPVIVWVTAENRDLRDQMFRLLSIELQDRYIHKSQNLSKVKVTDSFSLYQLLRQETAVTDTENDTYPLFHIFGLESLVTADENDPAEAFARELNFERELLFRHLPASVVFWSDEPAQVRVQSLAPDFWDWLVYKFHFRMLPGTLQWQHNIEYRFSGLATAMPPKQQQEIDDLEERLHKLDPLVTKGDRFAADYAQVALNLGNKWFFFDNHEAARALYQQALPLFEKVGSDLGKANTLQSLGDLEMRMSENDKARALYQQALPLFEKVGDDLGKANTLQSLGDLEMRMSENDKARALYQQALPLFEKVGDDLGKANTLKSLGDLERLLSENDKARALYQQALPLFEKVGDDLGKANTLKSLGDLERLLSENDKARALYQQALPLFEKVGSDLGKANTLKSLGDLERLLSENDKARALYQQALPLFEKVGSDLGKANTLKSLGDLERLLSENDKARALYQQALPLFEKVGSDLGKANIMWSKGMIAWYNENNGPLALEEWGNALLLYRKVSYAEFVANTLARMAEVLNKTGNNNQACTALSEAVFISSSLFVPSLNNLIERVKAEVPCQGQ